MNLKLTLHYFITFICDNRSATEAQSSQRIREISHKWTRIITLINRNLTQIWL
ncbi:MAG: hypothetical protein AB1414_13865 [bacterium]